LAEKRVAWKVVEKVVPLDKQWVGLKADMSAETRVDSKVDLMADSKELHLVERLVVKLDWRLVDV
jgi:hypothetical protein